MSANRFLLAALLASLVFLDGCVGAVIVGGAAAAAVLAHDRRTMGAQIDDKAIVIKATDAIRSTQGLTDATHVNITSVNGIVLLSGEAPAADARDKVLGAVRGVSGVRRTVNEIRIAAPSTGAERANDTWLTGKIKSKLVGVADLDSTQVKVVTEHGAVYLMGLVGKKDGEGAATAAAEVAGVERVVKLFEYVD